MTDSLGNIKKVSVRIVWPNEQQNFTPWLAKEENIVQLGDALKFELEVENTEVAVGPYSADILAKDLATGRYVVIENQFGKTNHEHLGKLITYASFLDARAVVWIAEEFTEEHQKSLDWLNDHTTDDLAFYGVVLELLQIDESRPAVRFNVVSRPAELVRQAAIAKASGELTDTRKLQLEFWTEFRSRLLESKTLPSAQAARPQYWYDMALGKSGIHLSAIANTSNDQVGIKVYIYSTLADAALPQLEAQRDAIEAEVGEKLEWNPNPENRDKIIVLYRKASLRERDSWPDHLDWLMEMTRRFRKAFVPRIKKLKFAEPSQSEEDE